VAEGRFVKTQSRTEPPIYCPRSDLRWGSGGLPLGVAGRLSANRRRSRARGFYPVSLRLAQRPSDPPAPVYTGSAGSSQLTEGAYGRGALRSSRCMTRKGSEALVLYGPQGSNRPTGF
jgi:hypothetical protein